MSPDLNGVGVTQSTGNVPAHEEVDRSKGLDHSAEAGEWAGTLRGAELVAALPQVIGQELASRISIPLDEVFTNRNWREQAQSYFVIPRDLTNGWSTDTLLGYAPVAAFVGAFLGCLTTLELTSLAIVPEIASALATALLCGQLLVVRITTRISSAFCPALYGGTFGGMTSLLWPSDTASGRSATFVLFVSLSIVCGLAFSLVAKLDARSAAPLWSGYGGRLGAIATAASFIFVGLGGLLGADASLFHGIDAGAFGVEPWAAAPELSASMAGVSATLFVLQQRRVASTGAAARIFVASAVALFGLMILHLGGPNDARTLDAFYAGCFLGMSPPERLHGWFKPALGAFVLTAVLVLVRAFLPGVGGRLGFAAFVTMAMLAALSRVTGWMTREILTRDKTAAIGNPACPRDREPQRISTPRMQAGFGLAIANASLAAPLVAGWLLHSNAATLVRLAKEVPGTPGAAGSEPVVETPARTPPQPVMAEAAAGVIKDLVPLVIFLPSVDNAGLGGLPSGSNMPTDRRSVPNGWHLSAYQFANTAIRPAPASVSGVDVIAERADPTVDRPALSIDRISKAPPAASTDAAPPSIGPSASRLAQPDGPPLPRVRPPLRRPSPPRVRRPAAAAAGSTGAPPDDCRAQKLDPRCYATGL
jgi:hypothetical protein